MMMLKEICVLSLMITLSYTAFVPERVLPPSLIQELKEVANQMMNQTATTTPPPPPGRMNVCDDLCPKWCEKIEGSPRKYTHCHYLCGNLCDSDSKVLVNNHFIGNPRYEVVPSEFQFERYDTNDDKFISMLEFTTAEQITPDEAAAIFKFTDFDNDGFISTDEFKGSPLVFTVQMAEELSNIANTKIQPLQ